MPGNLPPDPESVSNGQLYVLIEQLKHEMHTNREQTTLRDALVTRRMEELTGEVAMNRKETTEMVELWKSGKTVVSVIKVAGIIGTAILAWLGLMAIVKGAPYPGPNG